MFTPPSALARLPRLPLACLPTPVEELTTLTALLGGPRILMKRDDLTGLAFGGNKTRKLEFLIADALARMATAVITAGAAQSNHCRQTAAAAARAGLECHLVLGGTEPPLPNGNLLLDLLFGARIHWTDPDRRGERMEEIAAELAGSGKEPYVVPYGGSNGLGAVGYVAALTELAEQASRAGWTIDRILVASSSGGTQAGLVTGARLADYRGEILGISIDKGDREEVPYEEAMALIANDTAVRLGMQATFSPADFRVVYDYLGEGYGVVGDREREAIALLARTEGILLDPVYTGRAMGGLIDMVRKGRWSKNETVLFWHTGGGPALFAYADALGAGSPGAR